MNERVKYKMDNTDMFLTLLSLFVVLGVVIYLVVKVMGKVNIFDNGSKMSIEEKKKAQYLTVSKVPQVSKHVYFEPISPAPSNPLDSNLKPDKSYKRRTIISSKNGGSAKTSVQNVQDTSPVTGSPLPASKRNERQRHHVPPQGKIIATVVSDPPNPNGDSTDVAQRHKQNQLKTQPSEANGVSNPPNGGSTNVAQPKTQIQQQPFALPTRPVAHTTPKQQQPLHSPVQPYLVSHQPNFIPQADVRVGTNQITPPQQPFPDPNKLAVHVTTPHRPARPALQVEQQQPTTHHQIKLHPSPVSSDPAIQLMIPHQPDHHPVTNVIPHQPPVTQQNLRSSLEPNKPVTQVVPQHPVQPVLQVVTPQKPAHHQQFVLEPNKPPTQTVPQAATLSTGQLATETTTAVLDREIARTRFVKIDELTEQERKVIDERIGGCSIFVNKRCLTPLLTRIAGVVENGAEPADQQYLVMQFKKSEDKLMDRSEKALRHSFKLHLDKNHSNLCRFARFRLRSKQDDLSYYKFDFFDYTPYMEMYVPRYNPYTSEVDKTTRCEWAMCYCETWCKDLKMKNLKYVSVAVPEK